jgi:hypothetical protein
MKLRQKSVLKKLPLNRPLITYEDGRVVTLIQYALEQLQLLEPSENEEIKKVLRIKTFSHKTLHRFQVKI